LRATNAAGVSDTDSLKVIVEKGRPPVADAGWLQVIRLGGSAQTVNLDGSFSFSFVTDSPTYQWTGPTSFVGSTATSAVAQVSLDPNNFSKKVCSNCCGLYNLVGFCEPGAN